MNLLPEPIAGVFGLGAPELIIILVILMLLFGASKLPALAKGLGQSIREFKNASKDEPVKEEKKTDNPSAKPGNN